MFYFKFQSLIFKKFFEFSVVEGSSRQHFTQAKKTATSTLAKYANQEWHLLREPLPANDDTLSLNMKVKIR